MGPWDNLKYLNENNHSLGYFRAKKDKEGFIQHKRLARETLAAGAKEFAAHGDFRFHEQWSQRVHGRRQHQEYKQRIQDYGNDPKSKNPDINYQASIRNKKTELFDIQYDISNMSDAYDTRDW